MRGDRNAWTVCVSASLLAHIAWLLLTPSRSLVTRGTSPAIEMTIETSERPGERAAAAVPSERTPASVAREPAPSRSSVRDERAALERTRAQTEAVQRERESPRPAGAMQEWPPEHRPPRERASVEPTPPVAHEPPIRESEARAREAVATAPDPGRTEPSEEPVARKPSNKTATLDLTPRAAARSMLPSDSSFGRSDSCNPRGATSQERCEDELAPPPGLQVQDGLNQQLREAAKFHPYLAKREPPALKRASDGSYAFSGIAFDARIEPDGHVKFTDAADVRAGPVPIGGTFDLYDSIEKHVLGKEIDSAEKRWFLDQTAELRESMVNAARRSEYAHAKREVERELERVFSSAQSPSAKRVAVFALWEDCGDDDDSAAIRGLVEAFIRARMPQSSELGFSPSDLERLNRARPPQSRFDPYRSS